MKHLNFKKELKNIVKELEKHQVIFDKTETNELPIEIIEALLYEGETVEEFRKTNKKENLYSSLYNISDAIKNCQEQNPFEFIGKDTKKRIYWKYIKKSENISSKELYLLYNSFLNNKKVSRSIFKIEQSKKTKRKLIYAKNKNICGYVLIRSFIKENIDNKEKLKFITYDFVYYLYDII